MIVVNFALFLCLFRRRRRNALDPTIALPPVCLVARHWASCSRRGHVPPTSSCHIGGTCLLRRRLRDALDPTIALPLVRGVAVDWVSCRRGHVPPPPSSFCHGCDRLLIFAVVIINFALPKFGTFALLLLLPAPRPPPHALGPRTPSASGHVPPPTRSCYDPGGSMWWCPRIIVSRGIFAMNFPSPEPIAKAFPPSSAPSRILRAAPGCSKSERIIFIARNSCGAATTTPGRA